MAKVYAKTNDNGCIICVNSEVFLADLTDWVQIDEGDGDRYDHAQGNYLARGLADESGHLNYKLVDGVACERTEKEKSNDGEDD